MVWCQVRRRVAALGVAVLTVVAGASAIAPSPAGAVGIGVNWSSLPSPVPVMKTYPNITDGTVFAITQVGNTIVVGGTFTTVTSGGNTVTRSNLLAFDATTGALSSTFVPTFDNTVEALQPGPTAGTVYVGGNFNTVNGVKSKGITLLNLSDGSIVSTFKPAAMNGIVYAMAVTSSRLYITGSFTIVGGATHDGIASLVPTTGKLDPYVNVQLTGHHNYNGTGANGAVGGRSMAINPAGTRAMVVGNFKNADGLLRDQIVQIDLDTSPNAVVDPTWSSSVYTAACISSAFDTYVTDVQYSADGSYFAVTATGGGNPGQVNTDGTRNLCDSVSRFESSTTGADVQPTWTDFTGRDSLWTVSITGAAIYVGGHERWLNNYYGTDNAGQGAVPRPAIAALDPTSGVPLNWNPGRSPRGAGTYALLPGSNGLYIGGDQTYVGNRKYNTGKMAMFPLAGGRTPAPLTTASLPSNVYLAGAGTNTDQLNFIPANGSSIPTTFGVTQTVPNTGVAWSTTRGAFTVGNNIYFAQNGNLYSATFNGTTVGTPVLLDGYDDPNWVTIQTGSGQTYQGAHPTYLTTELSSITSAFYYNGRIYYTLAGKTALYSRWFSPDSGIIGPFEFTQNNVLPNNVTGMFISGSTLYYASGSTGGALHSRTFTNGAVGTIDTIADTTHDWRARSLFLYGPPTSPDNPPTAVITQASCTSLSCTFDGSGSSDPDGDHLTYSWDFGDGATASGVTASHVYAASGNYTVKLTVNDGRGGTNTASTQLPVSGTVATIAADGANGFTAPTSSVQNPSVTIPGNVGDTVLLFAGIGTVGVTNTVPAGWTQVTQFTSSTMQTTVYSHVIAAGDPTTVTLHLDAAARVDLQALAYSGVSSATPPFAAVGDANTNTHTTPTASGANPGAWAISYWSDRTSAGAETWALPAGVTMRRIDAPASGGGRVDAATADQPVSGTSYGNQTATVTTTDGVKAGRGSMLTVLLNPAIT